MQRLRPILLAASVLLSAGCRDADRLTRAEVPSTPGVRLEESSDSAAVPAPPAPKRPTVFLPPLAAASPREGDFDPSLAPVVEVCDAADAACAAPVARFTTTTGPGSETVRASVADQHYIVDWHTGRSALRPGQELRVRVLVDGVETASLDARVVASKREAPDGTLAVVPGRTLPVKFWIQKVRRLSVVPDAGVEGTPGELDSLFAFGAEVDYDFRAAAGFHGLVVTLDGKPAPAAGTVRMDRDHVLAAGAEAVRTVPAGAEPLVASARAILTSSDKPAAFQHHLELVAELYDRVGIEAAKARTDSVYAIAYDEVEDSAAVRQAHEALANHVFTIPEPDLPPPSLSRGGARLAVAAAAAVPTSGKVTFVTVNGVFSNPAGAADNLAAARTAARNAGVAAPQDGFKLFYNSSFLHSDQVWQRVNRCFDKALSDHRFIGYVILVPRLIGCAAEAMFRAVFSFDLFEAARQVLNLWGLWPAGGVHDARVFADTLEAFDARAENVVVIPHSQGNLLTQEALKETRSRGSAMSRRLCTGVVSLAAPVSGHYHLRPGLEKGIYVRDDMILLLPFEQAYPHIETDRSRAARKNWEKWYWWITGLTGPVKLFEQFKLHSMADSYLGARQSRDWITGAMAAERRTLVELPACRSVPVATVEITPNAVDVQVGRAAQLSMVARDSAGNVLENRAVQWASSNATVAPVSATGRVTGMREGTASVTATVEGVSATVPVRVFIEVELVQVRPESVTLLPGETARLSAVALDGDGNAVTGRLVAWESLSPSVARISPLGVVTAVAEGTADVVATVDGVSGSARVTVRAAPAADSLVRLEIGQSRSWTFAAPASGRVTLRYDARLDWSGTAGNTTVLEVTVDGVPVTDAALLNKASTYTYPVRGGTERYYENRGSWAGQAAPYWGLFWSPDFLQNDDPSNYYSVAGGQAYTFVLDVSSLVSRDGSSTITLRNRGEWLRDATGLAPAVVLRGVTIQAQ